MKTIRESYFRGVTARADDPAKNGVLRLCIFIEGEPDCGKTYAAIHALDKMGISTLQIGGGGTGKLDKLKPSHGAIVIDDDLCPNLLNMSGNYVCQAYRRNRNNPYWCGQYLVVTSNLTFPDWLIACGFHKCIAKRWNPETQKMDDIFEHHDALESRFYICRMDDRELKLVSPSKRGTYEEQTKRLDMFACFRDRFEEIAVRYTKDERSVDYEWALLHELPFC